MSFENLRKITNDLKNNYPEDVSWKESEFEWIKCLPPGSKGKIGRDIVTGLFQYEGHDVTYNKQQLHINGADVNVRLALMWEEGIVVFENNTDGDYDAIVCIGILPNSAVGWIIPKAEVWKDGKVNTENSGITAQHKGADAWIHVKLASVQPWLKPYGGTLEEMLTAAKKIV